MSKNVKWAVIQCLYITPEVITRSGRAIAINVLRVGDVAEILHESLFEAQNLKLVQMFFQGSSAAILLTRCYRAFFFSALRYCQ